MRIGLFLAGGANLGQLFTQCLQSSTKFIPLLLLFKRRFVLLRELFLQAAPFLEASGA